MSESKYPSVEYLRQCFSEENGRLFWLVRPKSHFPTIRGYLVWKGQFAGKEAGTINASGRCIINFKGKLIFRHMIIWAMHYEGWPNGLVDHKNGNPLDDMIGNLRIANRSQNAANSRLSKLNTSGYKGVTWDKINKKWVAQINVCGKHKTIGRFNNASDAHQAYCDAAVSHFGEFACFG